MKYSNILNNCPNRFQALRSYGFFSELSSKFCSNLVLQAHVMVQKPLSPLQHCVPCRTNKVVGSSIRRFVLLFNIVKYQLGSGLSKTVKRILSPLQNSVHPDVETQRMTLLLIWRRDRAHKYEPISAILLLVFAVARAITRLFFILTVSFT